ncbi:ATP dependent DEAD-box helicase [Perkinsela sp. CCAP 1560/4]|nr:ATP dependent DEAD-box helicase [Perkinsela sp. CCAP 1560/4]|eukprot:KNH09530.1 ATP dependent DEAD-box helicase [Perkinsela sp. CCAP 1560/4]
MITPSSIALRSIHSNSSIDTLRLYINGSLSSHISTMRNDCPCSIQLSLPFVTVSFSVHFPEIFAFVAHLMHTWNLTHTTWVFVCAVDLCSTSLMQRYRHDNNKAQMKMPSINCMCNPTNADSPASIKKCHTKPPAFGDFNKWCTKIASRSTPQYKRIYFKIFREAIASVLLVGRLLFRLPSISWIFGKHSTELKSPFVDKELNGLFQLHVFSPAAFLQAQNKMLRMFHKQSPYAQQNCFGFPNLVELCRTFLHILRPTAPFPQGGKEQLASLLHSGEDTHAAHFPFIVGDPPLADGLMAKFTHDGRFCGKSSKSAHFGTTEYMHSVLKHNQTYDPSIMTRTLSTFFLFAHKTVDGRDSTNPVLRFFQYALLDQSLTQLLGSALAMVMLLYRIRAEEMNDFLGILENLDDIKHEIRQVAHELVSANVCLSLALTFVSQNSDSISVSNSNREF